MPPPPPIGYGPYTGADDGPMPICPGIGITVLGTGVVVNGLSNGLHGGLPSHGGSPALHVV
jgi:hypothetical protein